MRIDDAALPAVRFLVGDGAVEILRLPVEASGGTIESVRPVQVQYRPGSDVVVRYSARVSWQGAPARRETLVAASAVHGTYPGVVPISAETPFGHVEIGVWRWPFDPVLGGLGDAVTAPSVAELLGVPVDDVGVEVVAFRPTERAVVRVTAAGEPLAYVKVVAPVRVAAIAGRHRALRTAGVPAPELIAVDEARGLLAMRPLLGPTLRDLVKHPDGEAGAVRWPPARDFVSLCGSLAGVELTGAGPASRIVDGVLHARMLSTVLPEASPVLDALGSVFEDVGAPPVDGVVHGDLHEGQVIVVDRRIVGLLDVDDAGPGATVDDVANLIARLHYRIVTATGPVAALDAYADALRVAALDRHDRDRLDVHTSAALVGLATGPFRIQSEGWRTAVRDLLDRALALLPDA